MQQRADYVLSMHKTVEAEREALKNKQRLTELPTHNQVALNRLRILGDEVDPETYEQILNMPPVPRQIALHEKTVGRNPKSESTLGSHRIPLQKEMVEAQSNNLESNIQFKPQTLDRKDAASSEDKAYITESSHAYMKATPDGSSPSPHPTPTAELKERKAAETKKLRIDESQTESKEPIISYVTPKEKIEKLILDTKEPISYPSSIRETDKPAYKRKYIESSVAIYDMYRTNSYNGSSASQQQRKAAMLKELSKNWRRSRPSPHKEIKDLSVIYSFPL